ELGVLGWSCCWDYVQTNRAVVDYLLAHGARHTIFTAVTLGVVDEIRGLIAAAPDDLGRRMDRTNLRRTPLHLAAVKRQRAAAEALIALGAALDAEDTAGLTPLDQAALNGDEEVVALLIGRGATLRIPAAVALQRLDDLDRLVGDEPDALRPGQRYG